MKCYIGPYGVLVTMGMVHSNNEFQVIFEFIILYNIYAKHLGNSVFEEMGSLAALPPSIGLQH